MIIPNLYRLGRTLAGILARIPSDGLRPPGGGSGLSTLDRKILADVGIGAGEILSLPRDVRHLRRPPHV
jgi:hypothetical protein